MNIPLPLVLLRRPRLLNPLHALGLVNAHTQTNRDELRCLEKYARGRELALEIGTHMGVSATVIARALADEGRLFCVDPWEPRHGRENPCLTICRRELKRRGIFQRVVFLQGFSWDIEHAMAEQFDFIFVDGDHSYEGLKMDWDIVVRRLAKNGIICLHDTTVPADEPDRNPGSVTFFNEVVRHHSEFEWLECCNTLNVLRRN